ncbi:MAG: hypothetical protein EYC62_09335 [Alphaproteobacteria bacterium]|nr:MAG: hypothetical protein EYC62_09335 [Alphaproteobacteria bacterium]
MGYVTNALFRNSQGHYSIPKIIGVSAVGLFIGPFIPALLAITWPAGPLIATTLVGGGLIIKGISGGGSKNVVIPQSEKFGAPTAEETRDDQKQSSNGKCYVNFRTLVPKISEAYRQSILGEFTPTKLGFVYTPDQKAEKLSEETTEKAKGKFWQIARDQLRALVELHTTGDYNKPVPTTYWDSATNSAKPVNAPMQWVVAAQRGALLDMIAVDRAANMIPLPEYTGEKKAEELKKSLFSEGQRVDPQNPKSPQWFDVAGKIRQNGDWSKNTPEGQALAGMFYNYAVGKLSNLINNDKAGAFDRIFSGHASREDAWLNCQIYSDACRWGLVDRHTRTLIAQRAHQVGRDSGDYTLYNFCMHCLADEKLLQDNAPVFAQVAADTKSSRDAFMNNLRGNAPSTPQTEAGNHTALLQSETVGDRSYAKALDAVKAEATKTAFGKGTQDLATNIAALQGLANGIEDEVFLGKTGWDKIRTALQNPRTRIFVAQGTARTLIGYIKSIVDMQRR